jgi:polyribonucleotide nucleotidyltransferase
MRRESRPSDEAILTARFIDRAIRPRFPKDLKREVQIVVTCLSWDGENDPDIIGLIAASLALSISNIPWAGPLSCLRVGRKEEKFVLNPTYTEREKKELDLSLAAISSPIAKFLGNKSNDDILINMIEGEGNEVDKGIIIEAVDFAKPYLKKLIDFQKEINEKIGKEKTVIPGRQAGKSRFPRRRRKRRRRIRHS